MCNAYPPASLHSKHLGVCLGGRRQQTHWRRVRVCERRRSGRPAPIHGRQGTALGLCSSGLRLLALSSRNMAQKPAPTFTSIAHPDIKFRCSPTMRFTPLAKHINENSPSRPQPPPARPLFRLFAFRIREYSAAPRRLLEQSRKMHGLDKLIKSACNCLLSVSKALEHASTEFTFSNQHQTAVSSFWALISGVQYL